ncbi:hypothetical protein L5I01_27765 [Gordonia sp. HY442]|uniref:hypothetical protein n=1 Tax=Gordonia zhenghanii TaxID=2911516 RepID=UPI001F30D36C|nr:hypothetical protein [Gordonia zhenghanii]MCF8607158.1 hypothetical protein [Gordonia zhenghanii]
MPTPTAPITRIRVVAAGAAVVLCAVPIAACSSGDDAPAGVSVELRSTPDHGATGAVPRLTLAVHNDSDAPCAVPKHGIGSAIVTSVTHDGTDVASSSRPIPTFAPSIDAVRAALTALSPGESLALDVQTATDPPAVESHVIDADGTLIRTSWPMTERGVYRITAALATPPTAARDDLPPLCAPTDPSTATFIVQ